VPTSNSQTIDFIQEIHDKSQNTSWSINSLEIKSYFIQAVTNLRGSAFSSLQANTILGADIGVEPYSRCPSKSSSFTQVPFLFAGEGIRQFTLSPFNSMDGGTLVLYIKSACGYSLCNDESNIHIEIASINNVNIIKKAAKIIWKELGVISVNSLYAQDSWSYFTFEILPVFASSRTSIRMSQVGFNSDSLCAWSIGFIDFRRAQVSCSNNLDCATYGDEAAICELTTFTCICSQYIYGGNSCMKDNSASNDLRETFLDFQQSYISTLFQLDKSVWQDGFVTGGNIGYSQFACGTLDRHALSFSALIFNFVGQR
jgi:hypothetical protein